MAKKITKRASKPTSRGSERKPMGVDPGIKQANLKRLKRLEGQVRGLQQMVEEDRYCVDILTQIAAAIEGLRAVGREVTRNHVQHCVQHALTHEPEKAGAILDELIDVLHRQGRR